MSQTTRFIVALTTALTGLTMVSCAQKEAYSGQPEVEPDSSDGPRVVQATPRVKQTSDQDNDGRSDRGNILNERLVFFDLDKSLIKQEYLPILEAHIDYLVNNRNARVLLQGHADERGSTEYNLALGQRRSDAVREYMVAGGIFADQLEAVSYGEERPRALGSNETAWAENRRVEIIYGDE